MPKTKRAASRPFLFDGTPLLFRRGRRRRLARDERPAGGDRAGGQFDVAFLVIVEFQVHLRHFVALGVVEQLLGTGGSLVFVDAAAQVARHRLFLVELGLGGIVGSLLVQRVHALFRFA